MTASPDRDETAAMRRLIFRPKTLDRDDGAWHVPPVPPRWLPFGRTLRLGSDWRWRVLDCSREGEAFTLFGRVNIRRGNYQAWLSHRKGKELRVLARMEDHGDHPGLHVHAHCGASLPDVGPGSIEAPVRRPRLLARRTVQGATLDIFWAKARGMFHIGTPTRTAEPQGKLPFDA